MFVSVLAVHEVHVWLKVNFNGIPVTLHVSVFDTPEQILMGHDPALFQQPFVYRGEIAVVIGFGKLKYRIDNPLELNDEVVAGNFVNGFVKFSLLLNC